MFQPLLLAFGQIADPAFRRPLMLGALLALLSGLALAAFVSGSIGWIAGGEGWIASLAAAAGALLVIVALVFLFIPLLLAIASLFTDGVAEAVERRHHPALPPAQGASAIAQAWAGTKLAARMALITVLLLPIALFVPVIGAVVLWAVAAVSLGQGLFQGVALRRMSAPEADALARSLRWPIRTLGAVLAAMALVVPFNLLVPVVGTAAMVHVLHRSRRK
jgi:uncharacterized protein involved in cysteine biosynthesis